jgi:hypothetical protein
MAASIGLRHPFRTRPGLTANLEFVCQLAEKPEASWGYASNWLYLLIETF